MIKSSKYLKGGRFISSSEEKGEEIYLFDIKNIIPVFDDRGWSNETHQTFHYKEGKFDLKMTFGHIRLNISDIMIFDENMDFLQTGFEEVRGMSCSNIRVKHIFEGSILIELILDDEIYFIDGKVLPGPDTIDIYYTWNYEYFIPNSNYETLV